MPLSAVQPNQYKHLLDQKVANTCDLLAPFEPPPPQVFESQPTGYRMRAEFRIWHEGEDLNYVMFRKDQPRVPVSINQFPIAHLTIQALMPKLLAQLKVNPILRTKLFQVEFLSTLAGNTLVTLIYHRKLDDQWEREATALGQSLDLDIVGRSRKQKCVIRRDYVEECLSIGSNHYRYRHYEQAFTQPNALLNCRMIEWACACAQTLKGDLLELYCGNGNFTLPLARLFENVIATEMSKASIRAARENTAANAIGNIEVVRLSAQEVTQAIKGEREFRRLADLGKPLCDYHLNTIFVDPPRAGLDGATEKMVSAFDSIIYISCNPTTLAANLQSLCKTHTLSNLAFFDQFPYTHHMECGVLLQKKA